MRITYHGTPRDYFEAQNSAEPYLPADFDKDGFIHCNDGREAVSVVLTLHYQQDPGDWVVLYIDTDAVTAPVRYEDPAQIFPHIHGPINRNAIVAVRAIGRAADGTFLMPAPLE